MPSVGARLRVSRSRPAVLKNRSERLKQSHPHLINELRMKASTLYRIAAVLLALFAVVHTLGFRQSDPKWGIDALLSSMHSIHFDMLGLDRTYWDFFVAAGFCVGLFYLFAAILAWQLGGLPPATLALMRG